MRIFRVRQADDGFFRHSEWVRRIGLPSSVSLVSIISIPLLVFVILPATLFSLSGPSTLISLIIAFLIVFLTANHLSELACAVPKNGVVYHFSFASIGELPAYTIAWISFLDSICVSNLLISAWSQHLNLLFRKGIHVVTSLELVHKDSENWLLTPQYDLLAVLSVVVSLFILCCSLKVMGTISICFLSVTILIIASCGMVAFFHADPQNWIDAPFFTHGYVGVLKGVCALLVAFCGVENTSYLLEETKNPRGRTPSLTSVLTVLLGIVFFFIIMIFSLATNVALVPSSTLIPEIFTVMNIPAARYMLTVASVCGLSGAVLSSFLPGSRILAVLAADGLLPFPSDSSLRSPIISIFFFSIFVSFSLLVKTEVTFGIVSFTTPIKYLIICSLTYIHHYTPEPVGIPHETSQYRKLAKRTRYLSDTGSIVSAALEDSQYSMDTAVFVQMNIAHMEQRRLQRQLEQEQKEELEKQPVLGKSVSQYQSLSNPKEYSMENDSHNCIAHGCSPPNTDDESIGNSHLYHREVPEIPYCSSFNGSHRVSTPIDMNSEYRKAKAIFLLFLVSSFVFCFLLTHIAKHGISSYVLLSVLLSLCSVCFATIHHVPTNDYIFRRKWKTPLFPHATLLLIFSIIWAVSSTSFTVIVYSFVWLVCGWVLYFCYGFWFSVEQYNRGRKQPSEDTEAYRAIIGEDVASEAV
ncbi:unnamed protein product [Auanema sp. JU1783]|nr:unnamed protein product [Auanema sp. JU1783]